MEIKFYPDSDLEDFKESVLEYKNIWDKEGGNIVESWQRHTGLVFRESFVNAMIVEDRKSQSHPLSLRSGLLPDGKKATLAHELGHRILYKRVEGMGKVSSLERHKFLDLIFYDVLKDIFGESTQRIIDWESNRPDTMYKEAWEWALGLSDEERKKRFKEILGGNLSLLN